MKKKWRSSIFSLLFGLGQALSDQSKIDTNHLSPTIFIPGILGTRLEAKLDRDWVPHYICSKQADWFTIWMNYEIIAPLGGTCWADNLKLHYNETSGRNQNTEGVELRPECYGSTDCIEWLDPHHLIPAGRYFHDIIQSFVREGYTVDYNLKAATYDWRYSPSELHEIGFFDGLKTMTEEMVEKFDKKVLYVVHSMGNPILTHFLNTHVDKKWKEKHVKIWAAIAPVFMGAPKSLKSLISGENDGIPRILVGNIQMRGLLRTFPSTYFLVPSIPKEHPESWPEQFKNIVQTDSRNYTYDDLEDIFNDMETEDYVNVSSRFVRWQKERLVADPDVNIHIFYGTGLDTPCAFDYTNRRFPDYSPVEIVCSGDSTVPVYSSTFPIKYWDKVKATEVPNADHNVLLRDDEVINQILSYAIDNYDPNLSLESKKLKFKPDLSNGKAIFKEIRRVLPID